MKSMFSGRSRLLLLLLAASVLPSSGCLAAGIATAGVCAAAGAGGYAYVKGRMTRDYPANLQDTLQATQTSLTELGFPVLDREANPGNATLVTETSNGNRITVDLTTQGSAIPADATSTRVGIRVGVFGDETISDRILDQIALHIVPGVRTGRAGAAPGALQPVAAQMPLPLTPPQVVPIPVRESDNPGVPALKQPATGDWRGAKW